MPKKQKKRIHFGADFESKIMDFGHFSTSGTPRSAQNAPPGALSENASNSDGFWDAFFRISMDLGSHMGGQKGFPQKKLRPFCKLLRHKTEFCRFSGFFRDFPQFSTKFPDFSIIFQHFLTAISGHNFAHKLLTHTPHLPYEPSE